MCLGKGITGGYLPMSVTVAAGHIYEEFLGEDLGPRTLYHGHSFGGNPLAAAVALRHLELLEESGRSRERRERSAQLRESARRRGSPRIRWCATFGSRG